MKVTAVTTLSASRFNYVKVETDEGISGVGELHPASGTGGTPFVPRAGVEYCAEYLVGKDPLHIERHWQHMFRRQLFRGGSDMMAAIGAIDIALWDIKGKALEKPVYELLGGPTREKVRLYTHLGGNTPEALAEEAAARVEEGFTALRVYPFGDFGNSDFEEGLGLETMSFTGMQRNAVERIAAVREAAGPDTDIMIDVVNRLTPAEAIGLGRALEPFNLYFYEDPIEPENMDQWGCRSATTDSTGNGRTSVHDLSIPRSAESPGGCIRTSRSVVGGWNHQCEEDRSYRRVGLRWCCSAQSAERRPNGGVRSDRRCYSQHPGSGISVRRRQRDQGRTDQGTAKACWRLSGSTDQTRHWRRTKRRSVQAPSTSSVRTTTTD